MIIDSHVHIGRPPPEADPDKFVELLKKSNIDRAIAFRYVYGKPTLIGNQLIRSAVSRYPDSLIGFAWIAPNDETAISEIRTTISCWQFKGIKLHMEIAPTSINRLGEVFREAEKSSVPICIHVGEDFKLLDDLCGKYDVDVIMAHLGTGVYNLDPKRLEGALELSEKHDNVYMETSGNTFFFIEQAVKRLAPSKILFGSDFPHEHPLVMVKSIELLELSKKDRNLILGENISRLIGS